jgi:hypothetical protein
MAIAIATGVAIAMSVINAATRLSELRKQLSQLKPQQIAHRAQRVEIVTVVNDKIIKRK